MQNGFITKAEQEALEEKVAILFQKRSDGSDYTAELEYVRERRSCFYTLFPDAPTTWTGSCAVSSISPSSRVLTG